ncbi:hypothetical protein Daus18300_009668 [Diaporthe australafricana]|uniref:F-box domain-containing protein n=1 Tax=Diaporthe australafricana TaxID=127596 RepID=A0ABR3WDN3_9PEZI
MGSFERLPIELTALILQHLSQIDLRSFLKSQASHQCIAPFLHILANHQRAVALPSRICNAELGEPPLTGQRKHQGTCQLFRLIADDILSHPPPPGPPRAARLDDGGGSSSSSLGALLSPTIAHNPVLAQAFGPLFSSAACFTAAERRRTPWFLTLNGDATRPFRRLSWAGDSTLRDAYLQRGASWRGLSVTFGRGPPVTRLEVVKSYSSEDLNEDGRDHVQYLCVDLPANGFLTMGLLYDLLLCGGGVGDERAATFGPETGGWDLLLGRRLRSHDLLVEYECFIPDDDELVDSGPDAAQSAILYVQGGTVEVDDQDRRFAEPEEDDVGWEPEMFGNVPRIRLATVQ